MFPGSRKIYHPKDDDINLASNVFDPGDDLWKKGRSKFKPLNSYLSRDTEP